MTLQMKAGTRPRSLKSKSRIGLVAPSGPLLEPDDLSRAIELCLALDLVPLVGAHVTDVRGYLAGSDDARLSDLNAAIENPDIDAIWCLRGGYGVTRILDRVNYDALASHPRIVLGYSDITALLLAVHARTGIPTFHGPVARQGLTEFSRRHLVRTIFDPPCAGELALPSPPPGVMVPRSPRVVTVVEGVAEGPLIGGNLSLLHCLVGTPYLPSLEGAILFLEDTGEALYAIDRILSHLRLAGLLAGLAGVAIGHFTDLRRDTAEGALGLETVLRDYFASMEIPVVHGFPIGHLDDQWTLPIGCRAKLDATHRSLTLLEPAVHPSA